MATAERSRNSFIEVMPSTERSFNKTNASAIGRANKTSEGWMKKSPKTNTELSKKANMRQAAVAFENFKTEELDLTAGQSMYRTQRVGAGSLGPNFAGKGKQFLPVLKKASENLQMRHTLRSKLQSPDALTNEDW